MRGRPCPYRQHCPTGRDAAERQSVGQSQAAKCHGRRGRTRQLGMGRGATGRQKRASLSTQQQPPCSAVSGRVRRVSSPTQAQPTGRGRRAAGVGISGQEGMQAVMSSNFSIAQVRAAGPPLPLGPVRCHIFVSPHVPVHPPGRLPAPCNAPRWSSVQAHAAAGLPVTTLHARNRSCYRAG